MIIGNNNTNNSFKSSPTFTSNFDERFNKVKEEGLRNQNKINPFQETSQTKQFSNVNSKNEMAEKSFAMLQERYNNGLISLDEFTKKCNQLNKLSKK